METESTTPRRTIGNLNGHWARLFKFTLAVGAVIQPALLALGVWLINEAFESRAFRNQGDRFTATDAVRMEQSLSEKMYAMEKQLRSEMAQLPPPEFRKKVESIDLKLEAIAANVVELRIVVAKLK